MDVRMIAPFISRQHIVSQSRKWSPARGLATAALRLLTCLLAIVATGMVLSGPAKAQLPDQFQKVDLVTGLTNATTFKFAPDGRIFLLDRYGELIIYKPDLQTTVSAGTLNVFYQLEDGLIGIAFDPNFLSNNYIYLHYSPAGYTGNRVSRFRMVGDSIDLSSEVIVLEWPTQRRAYYHAAGDMQFDSQGNLYIATGDNSNHSDYSAINESDPDQSAERTASNTNDLRGKILRIRPEADGSYSIPSGNLFPNGVGGRPEIYVMGARNPYRITVDSEGTDWLFWAEVGPDANAASSLGPVGLDEINLTKTAGNYGWPYFAGDNEAYLMTEYSPQYYNDPATPRNTSIWNTGLVDLPPAQPSLMSFFHKAYLAGPRYYYNPTIVDQQRLPQEYDERFFYFDFNSSKIWTVGLDSQGNILPEEEPQGIPFAPEVFPNTPDGFLDMRFGPDGHLYILAYGAGCCPENTGTGRLIRVDYTGIVSNSAPIVEIAATPTNGALPLEVSFSSDGTFDPDGDTDLEFAWDFQTDGVVDSTSINPTFTYAAAGEYNAQLRVTDPDGATGVRNITITAGNTASTFQFVYPPNGAFMNWDDELSYEVGVEDPEDGSTENGGIDCSDLNVTPSFGHLTHFHDGLTSNACTGTHSLYTDHNIHGQDNIYFVLLTNYTDRGGLTSFDRIQLYPKRMEAEFYDEISDAEEIANTDAWGGARLAIRANHGGYLKFGPRNLLNIDAVKYRVASSDAGGSIELRLDSPTGPLVSTTQIPDTGGPEVWEDVQSNITDPSGTHDFYFVFKKSAGQRAIFDLNYIEFIGSGVSVETTPPRVESIELTGNNSVKVEFSEPLTEVSATDLSNYSMNNDGTILSAELQPDGRTVIVTTSALTPGLSYTFAVSSVTNTSGLAMGTSSQPFSIFAPVRLNSGGEDTTVNGENFDEDAFFTNATNKFFPRTQAQKDSLANVDIQGTSDDTLYKSERFGEMSYNIPVNPPGEYDVRLHFAEIYYGVLGNGGVGSRVFDVYIEGKPVLENFDILAETNPATALVKEFDNISVTDGELNIEFKKIADNPKVSGIEVLSSDAISNNPSITINSPGENDQVNQPFPVSFTVEDWNVEQGDTHLHYFIDGQMVSSHYSLDPIVIDGLSNGEHTIRIELFNANHSGSGFFDEVTVNVTDEPVCNDGEFPTEWQAHALETTDLPYRAVYILPHHDLNGDGYRDIATGGWWYENPQTAGGNWIRRDVGEPFKNVALVDDFDGDGDYDLLGTQGAYEGSDLVWAENDGSGNFTVHTNIPSGDTTYREPFLAGIAGGVFVAGGPYQYAINWNGAETGTSSVQMLTPPADPVNDQWTLVDIHPDSLGEDINAADIDRDGDLDLFQGGNWLRNDQDQGGTWTSFSTGITYDTTLDRAKVADFNGDGFFDAVVGQLGLRGDTAPYEFSYFLAPEDPTGTWVRNILDNDVQGSLSVYVEDMDFDGDQDIIVGEWRGAHRLIAFENVCNSGEWNKIILDSGSSIDHHDGAIVTDIDNDGDYDVVSIGWNEIIPRVFENVSTRKLDPTPEPTPTPTPGDEGFGYNSGGNAVDGFNADAFFSTNTRTYSTTSAIANTSNAALYQSERWTSSDALDYAIPVSNGTYSVELHFAEIYFGVGSNTAGVGARVFNIDVENSQGTRSNYDIIAEAGAPATAVVEVFENITVEDGTLNITLQKLVENPKISGIRVIPASTSNTAPVVSAGSDTTITLPANSVELAGFASDPDGGAIVEYSWTQVSGPNTATLTGIATPTLNASGLIEGTYTFRLTATDDEATSSFDDVVVTVNPASTGGAELKVNAGGGSLPGGWIADEYFSPSNARSYSTSDPIESTTNQELYQTERFAFGNLVYEIPVTNGTHQVNLHFAEIYFGARGAGGVGSRVFNINVEDQGTRTNYDIFAAAGGALKPVVETFSGIEVTDGFLTITLTKLVQSPKISGIEIVSGDSAGPLVPLVDAGADQEITLPTSSVALNGTASDPDGGSITSFEWAQIAGPSTATLSGEFTQSLQASDLQAGEYTFRLTVTDDESQTATDDVVVVVNTASTTAPVVDAGADATITLPTSSIALAGSANDPDGGNIVTTEWSQISGPNTAVFTPTDSLSTTASGLVEGSYVFSLSVTDDEGETADDQVTVTVSAEGTTEVARINVGGGNSPAGWSADDFFSPSNAPTYTSSQTIAGTDIPEVYQSERFSYGNLVYNIPVQNGEHEVKLHFAELWYGIGAPGGVGSRVFNIDIEGQQQVADYDIVEAAGAPATAVVETFSGITVNDGFLTITLTKVVEHPKLSGIEISSGTATPASLPVVNAGADQTVTLPDNQTTLSGSASDPDGGSIVAFAWTQEGGPSSAILTGEDTATLGVESLIEGTYVFKLTATDDEGAISSDEATVTVVAASTTAPLADAGPDQAITQPDNAVTLNGSGSDPDGGSVTFGWTQLSGPSTATLTGQDTSSLTAEDLLEGVYVFRITVTDDELDTATADVTVTVNASASEPTETVLRSNAGGPGFTFNGNTWTADQNFSTSRTYSRVISIDNTENDQLYQSERFSLNGIIDYQIPVENGEYEVRLHFAEIYYGVGSTSGGVGSRIFNITIENGQGSRTNYDIVEQAGGSAIAVVEVFSGITVSDGVLNINLQSVIENPKISGIEIRSVSGITPLSKTSFSPSTEETDTTLASTTQSKNDSVGLTTVGTNQEQTGLSTPILGTDTVVPFIAAPGKLRVRKVRQTRSRARRRKVVRLVWPTVPEASSYRLQIRRNFRRNSTVRIKDFSAKNRRRFRSRLNLRRPGVYRFEVASLGLDNNSTFTAARRRVRVRRQ